MVAVSCAVQNGVISDEKCTTAAKPCQSKEPGADDAVRAAADGVAVSVMCERDLLLSMRSTGRSGN